MTSGVIITCAAEYASQAGFLWTAVESANKYNWI